MVRSGQPKDLPLLGHLLMEAYRGLERYGEESEAEARRYIRWLWYTCKQGFLVAEADGEPVGFIAACANWRDPELGVVLEIHEIVVEPRWQGRGVGQALLERAYALGRARGRSTAALWVGKDNFRARAWYKKLGFEELGTYGDWVRMARPIPSGESTGREFPQAQ